MKTVVGRSPCKMRGVKCSRYCNGPSMSLWRNGSPLMNAVSFEIGDRKEMPKKEINEMAPLE